MIETSDRGLSKSSHPVWFSCEFLDAVLSTVSFTRSTELGPWAMPLDLKAGGIPSHRGSRVSKVNFNSVQGQ